MQKVKLQSLYDPRSSGTIHVAVTQEDGRDRGYLYLCDTSGHQASVDTDRESLVALRDALNAVLKQ